MKVQDTLSVGERNIGCTSRTHYTRREAEPGFQEVHDWTEATRGTTGCLPGSPRISQCWQTGLENGVNLEFQNHDFIFDCAMRCNAIRTKDCDSLVVGMKCRKFSVEFWWPSSVSQSRTTPWEPFGLPPTDLTWQTYGNTVTWLPLITYRTKGAKWGKAKGLQRPTNT